MLELLLSLPGWLLSFAAGIICAVAGLVLVRVMNLRGAWLRYLPLALAALGYAAADRFALPELMRTDLAHCAIATETAKQTTTERAGTKPDPVTTFLATTADCAARTLLTRYEAEAPRSAIDQAGLAAVEQAFTADTCGTPQLRRLLNAGWSIENEYVFTAGEPMVLTARC